MITIQTVDLSKKKQVDQFIAFPFRLYRDDPGWVPPLWMDMKTQMDKRKNPFFEHSDADFFLALQDGQVVGRIAALENRHFNEYHHSKKAQFYYFECVRDFAVATLLFERVFAWARQRGLDTLIGPKGMGIMDGYGILLDGFDQRTMMTSMNYNPPYYPEFLERLGFTKEVDWVSCMSRVEDIVYPERVNRIAERVESQGTLKVQRFTKVQELKAWAGKIGEAYNHTFVNNWEYAPLTPREVKNVVDTLVSIADPRLIKIITHGEDVVGFIFAFPDPADAVKRCRGRLFPFGLLDIMLEMRRTPWVAVNAMGILPEFQGLGGNALLYSEMLKTVRSRNFTHAALYQVAETAEQMRHDLENVGVRPYRNHRVYQRAL